MTRALVLMTALVPTTGHADLIRFASELGVEKVHVLISERSFEPIFGSDRITAFEQHFADRENIEFILHSDDDAPQNPSEHEEFWAWWRDCIYAHFPELRTEEVLVVASEKYGQDVADSLDNGSFIPYDPQREINTARGEVVRRSLWNRWNTILPEFRSRLMLTATMFGQDSVGKTTLTREVARALEIRGIPEWARPYLETVGAELSEEKMSNIARGQRALQASMHKKALTPALVQDTDLFTTVGYYAINSEFTAPDNLIVNAHLLASDVYYLLPDTIPFCEDDLRYGGNVRESDKQFWIDLLVANDLQYVDVPSGTVEEKVDFIAADIIARFDEKNKDVSGFLRD